MVRVSLGNERLLVFKVHTPEKDELEADLGSSGRFERCLATGNYKESKRW